MRDTPPPGRRPCSDPLAAAVPFLGVPYRRHGDDPATGWDCRGCVAYLRRAIFDLPSPGMDRDAYSVAQAADPAEVARLMAERRGLWREVPVRPGAVLLFDFLGHAAHVGLALTPSEFVHTLEGQETTIVRLADSWSRRLRGAYDCSSPVVGVRFSGAVLAPD